MFFAYCLQDSDLWRRLAFKYACEWATDFDTAHGCSTKTDWRWELRFYHLQRVKLFRAGGATVVGVAF